VGSAQGRRSANFPVTIPAAQNGLFFEQTFSKKRPFCAAGISRRLQKKARKKTGLFIFSEAIT
jgi:hypothetical protein